MLQESFYWQVQTIIREDVASLKAIQQLEKIEMLYQRTGASELTNGRIALLVAHLLRSTLYGGTQRGANHREQTQWLSRGEALLELTEPGINVSL